MGPTNRLWQWVATFSVRVFEQVWFWENKWRTPAECSGGGVTLHEVMQQFGRHLPCIVNYRYFTDTSVYLNNFEVVDLNYKPNCKTHLQCECVMIWAATRLLSQMSSSWTVLRTNEMGKGLKPVFRDERSATILFTIWGRHIYSRNPSDTGQMDQCCASFSELFSHSVQQWAQMNFGFAIIIINAIVITADRMIGSVCLYQCMYVGAS